MFIADFPFSQGIIPEGDVDRVGGGVDLHRWLTHAGDGDVSRTAERRLDVKHGAAYLDSIDQPRSRWHDDGHQHTDYAYDNYDFEQTKRVSPCHIPSVELPTAIGYDRRVQ
jgi:hypothetical protein